jgi:hypothetical protein
MLAVETIGMNKNKAKQLFQEALLYCEENFEDELEWAKSVNQDTFKKLTASEFLEEYCWVVYVSGFRVSTIEELFPRLKKAFKNFDLESLAQMLSVFNNKRKADFFLKGSKIIVKESFQNFKKRLKEQGIDVLEALPGIGPITKNHLAKNIGFMDIAKPDIWLVRAAESCNTTVDELVTFLSNEYGISHNAVDVVLWRHTSENKVGLKPHLLND